MNISKQELFNDYYLDEIYEILHEYNRQHSYDKDEDKTEYVGAETFFGF